MKTILKETQVEQFNSGILDSYFKDLKLCFFDIEATGLSPKYCSLIMGGFAWYEDGLLHTKQFLAENKSHEKEVLQAIKEELAQFDVIVNFNGRHYDMPFVKERFKKFGLIYEEPLYVFDIYLLLARFSGLRKALPHLNQKTVERYFDLTPRMDEISGKDSVILYGEYEETQDHRLEQVILLHNYEDIVNLYKLMVSTKVMDLHKAFNKMGLPVNSKHFGDLQITRIHFNGNVLELEGSQHNDSPIDYVYYPVDDFDLKYDFTSHDKSFRFSIPVEAKGKSRYINLYKLNLQGDRLSYLGGYSNDFLILRDEDQVQYEEVNRLIQGMFEEI
ncbi:MAG: ribonuclease H-like domain-containing protein [Clostridia bacterium]|nr:ribonuclease H-like domain-containing protein [Clostridia bacterium]